MGSCCGTLSEFDADLQKYESLYIASQMDRTANNQIIAKREPTVFIPRSEFQAIVNSPLATQQLKTLLSPPHNSFDRITPNLFLTGVGGMFSENLESNKIKCIINATFEAPNYNVRGIQSIRVPVEDHNSEDLYLYFDDVSDKLNDVIMKKRRAVVHSVAGVSRSTTLVLAYLMKYKKMTLKNAFTSVRNQRSVARPRIGFFKQLIVYENKLFGQNSVELVPYEKDGNVLNVPDFYISEYPDLLPIEIAESNEMVSNNDQIIDEMSKAVTH